MRCQPCEESTVIRILKAADFGAKSAQAPRPYRQALRILIKTTWRGSDRVVS